jgi:dipeptidyl aminopeptidase/acylaminoacyl peptidase
MNLWSGIRPLWLALLVLVAAPAWAAGPPALSAYGGLPGIEDMSISPSGEGLAIVGRMDGQRQLVVFDRERRLRATAPIGETKLRYIRWVGEDVVMIVSSVTEDLGTVFTADKAEIFGAVLVPVNGGKPEMIFGNRSNIAKSVFGDYGVRKVDGKWLAYFGGVELKPMADRMSYMIEHTRPALFGVDAARNAPRKIAPSPSAIYWRRWLIDDRGVVAATLDRNHVNGRWHIANERGSVIASGTHPTGDVRLVAFGQTGATVIYATEDEESGERRWLEVPLVGGASNEVFADADIERTYVDPTNGRLLGYLQRGTPPTPVLFDPAHQSAVRKVYRAFPRLDLRIVEWTPDFTHFLVHTSGNGDSGTWYVVDMARGKADPVGNDYPLVVPEAVGNISTVSYKAADGLDLDGILTLPPGREPRNLPVVMLPHGGPHSYDKAQFDWWAQAFAARGFAVFQPNFRGSTNRDEAFRRAGYGQWGLKMQSDLSDGLSELARQGIVDPRRACIVGASYGGYAALAGVTLQQGLYRCSVAVAPVSDLRDMYWTDYRESGGNKMIKRALQESLGPPSGFAAVSPRRLAGRADAPILLIHGKDDTVVPFKQSSAMADALRAADRPHELVVLEDEDHWLSRPETRKQMLEATMRFVIQHNPPD